MKTVLLATSALVAFTGAAAAEVSLRGDARIGLRYDSGFDTDAVDIDEGWNVISRARVHFDMSGETDAGLSFGASFRADQASNANRSSNSSNIEGTVWIEGAYGRLTAGDIDSGLESAVGDLPQVGLSGLNYYNEFTYTTSDFDSESGFTTDYNFNNAGLLYEYKFGDASIYASFMDQYVGTSGEEIDGDAWAIGAGYKLGNYTFGIGYESANVYLDPVLYVSTAQSFDDDTVFSNDNTTWGISGGTSWAGVTFKAIYLTTSVDGELGADSFSADDYDIAQYGIGAEYEMANGIGIAGFWRRVDGDDVGGFDHEADMYGIGASYDLGGGAEIQTGIVQLDGTSPFYGGDFDRTSADFGLSLKF